MDWNQMTRLCVSIMAIFTNSWIVVFVTSVLVKRLQTTLMKNITTEPSAQWNMTSFDWLAEHASNLWMPKILYVNARKCTKDSNVKITCHGHDFCLGKMSAESRVPMQGTKKKGKCCVNDFRNLEKRALGCHKMYTKDCSEKLIN